MTERKIRPYEFVDVQPLEAVVKKDGVKLALDTRSSSEEVYEEFKELLEDSGIGVEETNRNRGCSSSFFFGSWDGSTWQPEGPKSNWRVPPPEDPHTN